MCSYRSRCRIAAPAPSPSLARPNITTPFLLARHCVLVCPPSPAIHTLGRRAVKISSRFGLPRETLQELHSPEGPAAKSFPRTLHTSEPPPLVPASQSLRGNSWTFFCLFLFIPRPISFALSDGYISILFYLTFSCRVSSYSISSRSLPPGLAWLGYTCAALSIDHRGGKANHLSLPGCSGTTELTSRRNKTQKA